LSIFYFVENPPFSRLDFVIKKVSPFKEFINHLTKEQDMGGASNHFSCPNFLLEN